MPGPWPALTGFGAPHDERKRAEAGDDDRHDEEAVFEADGNGLALHGKVGHRHGFFCGRRGVEALRDEHGREAVEELSKICVAHAGVGGEPDQVRLVLAGQEYLSPEVPMLPPMLRMKLEMPAT